MRFFGDVLEKNIDVDVFDDVLQNTKHRANDASNDVNRPPLQIEAGRCNCTQLSFQSGFCSGTRNVFIACALCKSKSQSIKAEQWCQIRGLSLAKPQEGLRPFYQWRPFF